MTDVIYQGGYSNRYFYDKLGQLKVLKTFGPDEKHKIVLLDEKNYSYNAQGLLEKTWSYYSLTLKGAMNICEYKYTNGLLCAMTNYTLDSTLKSGVMSFNYRFELSYKKGILIKELYTSATAGDIVNNYIHSSLKGLQTTVIEHKLGESLFRTIIQQYKGVLHPLKVYDPATPNYIDFLMKSTQVSDNAFYNVKQKYKTDAVGRVVSITSVYPNQDVKPQIVIFKYKPFSP